MNIQPLGPSPHPALPGPQGPAAPAVPTGPADEVRLGAVPPAASSPAAASAPPIAARARQSLAYAAAGAASGVPGSLAAQEARDADLRLARELEDRNYEFKTSKNNKLTPDEFVERLHDPSRRSALTLERGGGPSPLKIRHRDELDPLRFFYLQDGVLTERAEAGQVLRSLGEDLRVQFYKERTELDAFEAWRAGDGVLEVGIPDNDLPDPEVRSLEDLFLVAHVYNGGPEAQLSNPVRARLLKDLKEEEILLRLGGQSASVVQLYHAVAPVEALNQDEAVLTTLDPAELDRPTTKDRLVRLRDLYSDLDRAVYRGGVGDLWELGTEPAGPAALEERMQALAALAGECRNQDDIAEAYRLARDTAAASGRPLGDVAAQITTLVGASDAERGLEAFRKVEGDLALHPPAGMDAAAVRASFGALVERMRDVEGAARVWDRLMAAPVPEAPADRLAVFEAWHKAGNLYNKDAEEALDAILRHLRPGETLAEATADHLALAGTLSQKREGAAAFEALRRLAASDGPVPAGEKEQVLRGYLAQARSVDVAVLLFEAALEGPDAAEFRDRVAVQSQLLRNEGAKDWSSEKADEAWKILASRAENGRIMSQANRRSLDLLPAARRLQKADELREALLAAPGPRSYEEKVESFLLIHRASPEHPRTPDRTLDDLRFLVRRVGPDGDLRAASRSLARYLDAAGSSDEARMALEIDGAAPSERFLRLLQAGGRALPARDAARLAEQVAETATVERLLASLMARHRVERDAEGVAEAVRFMDSLLEVPPGTAGAMDASLKALEDLPRLDDWKAGKDGSFRRWLERRVLAGCPDRDEAASRLEDLAVLRGTCRDEEDLDPAWTAFQGLPPLARRERIRAFAAMRAVESHDLAEDLDRLDFLARTLLAGDDLVAHAELFARVADNSNRPRHDWLDLRDWLEVTGDASPARLRRYAEVLAAHGSMTLENVIHRVEVPVGAESLRDRENVLWGLADGPQDLDEALGDYNHLTKNLNLRVTLEDGGRAYRLVRRALAGDRMKTRKIFDLLHGRLDLHPEASLIDLAEWFARNMTVSSDPEALVARLDDKPEDLRIERGEESVVIGGVRIPVRTPQVRPWAWLLNAW